MAAQHRYLAACSAALAAAAKGSGEPPLDEPARPRWRRRALDWLRADLAYGAMLVRTGSPIAREVVTRRLRSWKADPELAAVRDEPALNELPEAERRAWRDFWAEVGVLIGAP
jgi:hypothetical protein